jgi:Mg2+/Co2+ transporter CorC
VLTHENGYLFRVLDADARHIRRVRVRKLGSEGENTSNPQALAGQTATTG